MNRRIIKGLLLGAALSALVSINTKDTYAVNNEFDTSMEASYASTYKSAFYTMLPGSPLEYEPEDGVDTATGNLRLLRTDLELEGTGGMDFELARYYNSKQANIGDLTVEAVDELKVDNVYVSFKNDSGENHTVIVSNTIFKNRPQALKDMLGSYKKAEEGRKDTVKNTQRSKIKSNYENNVYGISTGWAFDFPWIETMTVKEGEESGWGEKPVYLHWGSKGIMPISTKENTSTHKYMITGIEGYDYEDIKLEDIDKEVNGVQCRYLLRDKTGLRTYFNKDGVIVLQRDAHNNTISYSYRNKIYFDKIVDSVGREINFHYKKEVDGMQFLESVTVEGKKVKGGVSSKTVRYAISEKSYATMRSGTIYGSILESATVDGAKEKYNYKTVETLMNAAGAGIASQRAVTNQAYLIQGVESKGAITHYEYRAGAFRGLKDTETGQKRDVVTQVYYVTREYEQDAKTKKKANGIKYDYYQNQDGILVSFGDLDNDSHEMYNYGTDDLSCVALISSFNPKKYKSNGLMSDYTYKKSDINVKTLQLKKQPKKNVTMSIYNENSLIANEVEDGKEKNETLYSYDKSGKGSLVVLETGKEYGTKRSSKPRTTKSGWTYDKYRNILTEIGSKAYLSKNKGKEKLFTTTYTFFDVNNGYPANTDKAYVLDLEKSCKRYLDKQTSQKEEGGLGENQIDIVKTEMSINTNSKEYQLINVSESNYDSYGNETRTIEYPQYNTDGKQEKIQYNYTYNSFGQQIKTEKEVWSEKNPKQNSKVVMAENTYDNFGNELSNIDENGLKAVYSYNGDTGEAEKMVNAVGTQYESEEDEYISEDSLKTMTIDSFNRCSVEIMDAFGNTVIAKDEKEGTWTESDYEYESENEDEEDSDEKEDSNVEALLVEERVYAFNPEEDKIITDSEGEQEYNYDIGGKGKEMLSGERNIYDDYGNQIVSAEFSGGAMDAKHCSAWTLEKEETEIDDEQSIQISYTKQLNPVSYQKNVSEENYYNQFDSEVLREDITKTIADEEGNVISTIITSKSEKDQQIIENTYEYDDFGRKTQETTIVKKCKDGKWLGEKEKQTAYEYDCWGNVTQTTLKEKDKNNGKWETQITKDEYNVNGQKVASYNPEGVKKGYATKYEYDLSGNLIKTIIPIEKKNEEIVYQTTENIYNSNGELIGTREQQTDSNYVETEYQYDAMGNLVFVKNVLSDNTAQYTQYVYDSEGNKIRQFTGLTKPLTLSLKEGTGEDSYQYMGKKYCVEVSGKAKKDNYSETKYEYNKKNELVTETNPEGDVTTYTYDVYGNQVKNVDYNGNIIKQNYDYQNRLIKSEAIDSETGDIVAHTWKYDKYGNICEEDGTQYERDILTGLVTKETNQLENGKKTEKNYVYDSEGKEEEFSVSVGGKDILSYRYDYDAFSRLLKVNETDSGKSETIAEYTYDNNGNLMTKESKAGTVSYDYNEANCVVALENKVNNQVVSRYHAQYLKNGQRQSETRTVKNEDGEYLEQKVEYSYDTLGRLTKEAYAEGNSISYAYDAHNNRVEMTTGSQKISYRYNKNDELVRNDTLDSDTKEDTVILYKNDRNGNQLATVQRKKQESNEEAYFDLDVTLGGNRLNDNVVYHYNAENQMIEALTKDTKVEYEYNTNGLRTKKTVNGKETIYVWDNDQIVMELDGKGNVKKRYFRGTDLIYSDAGEGTEKEYYVTDMHGNVVQLLDEAGNIIKTYEYDAFGNEKNVDKKDDNPFRYCGEYYDKETESIYLRARYYTPLNSRFLSCDDIREYGNLNVPLSLNAYIYCHNDPVNSIDPSGHSRMIVSGGRYSKKKKTYYYEFIEPALKEIGIFADEKIEWMIADCGWTKNDKKKIREEAFKYGNSKKTKIIYFKSKNQLINRINKKRKKQTKITDFTVFAHGRPQKIMFGYDYVNENKKFTLKRSDIKKIHKKSFNKPTSRFFSCRTAKEDKKGNSFALTWIRRFGGATTAYVEQTDYSNINQTHEFDNEIYQWMYDHQKVNHRKFPQASLHYPEGEGKVTY